MAFVFLEGLKTNRRRELMMFIKNNPNPEKKIVGDCVIRAIAILLDTTWEEVYEDICVLGREMYDMPSSNDVWSEYLFQKGYSRNIIPDTCPACYTVRRFCEDHRIGEYLLATGTHVVTVIDGNYHDTWDSGDEVPIYYFDKRRSRE